MLRILRRGQRWILWIVIVVVGGAFVVFYGSGSGGGGAASSPTTIVQVANRSYSIRDVDRVRRFQEESYREQLGDAFDREAVAEYLDEAAARTLLTTALLATEAERLGLRVTDPEIRNHLRTIPGAANARGRIDRDAVRNHAEQYFGTLRAYQEFLRDSLLAQKASSLLSASVDVSQGEARVALRTRQEEVDLAFVALDPKQPPPDFELSGETVAELLAGDPNRVKQSYEARIEEFDLPERVRARHILIRVPGAAPEEMKEGLRKNAEEALERIRGGADFADVAMEVSGDPGSRDQGGDLGFFPRGRMVKPFEDVAFSLEPGEVSDVVTTVHGHHVIKVEEKRPPEKTPLEDVQEQLARELLTQDAAAAHARTSAAALVTAVREDRSLVDAARELGISIERPEPLLRRPDGRIPGLGPAPEVMAAAFALEAGRSLDRIFDVGGKRVMIEVLARREPTPEEIDAHVEDTRRRLAEERRNRIQQAWIAARSEALAASGDLSLDLEKLRP